MAKKLLAVFTLGVLGSFAAFSAEMTGYISDEKCAKSASSKKAASEWINPAKFEQCAKSCVKSGSPAVFVSEDNKIYKIDPTSVEKVNQHVGQKVTVNGKVDDGVLTVDSIDSVKM
ncbi:MAG TPA: hypothetical protein VKU01_18350 [Bryobacteraceae bacterium]|nr:hypothetical protein [Bryobacteraceae bacterium]